MNQKALFTIFMIVLTDIIGFGIIIPLLPSISENLNITGLALGFFTASYGIAQFFSSPVLGYLSDRYGRKPILVFSKAGTVLAYLMLAFSRNYALLILSRLIDGFTGGNIPAARAYIADVTTRDNRARGMAIIGIAFSLGFIVGPAIGGIFYSIGGSQTLPALIGAGLSLFSLILTQIFLDESHRSSRPVIHVPFSLKNFFRIFKNPVIRQILLAVLVGITIVSGIHTTLPFFTTQVFGFSTTGNSTMLVYLGILGLLVQGVIIRRIHASHRLMTDLGIILATIGVLLVALAPNSIFLYFDLIFYSAGTGLAQVFLPALLSTASDTDPEGEVMGAFEGVSSLARVIGPAIFGSLIIFSPRPLYFLAALGLILGLYLLPQPQNPQS